MSLPPQPEKSESAEYFDIVHLQFATVVSREETRKQQHETISRSRTNSRDSNATSIMHIPLRFRTTSSITSGIDRTRHCFSNAVLRAQQHWFASRVSQPGGEVHCLTHIATCVSSSSWICRKSLAANYAMTQPTLTKRIASGRGMKHASFVVEPFYNCPF